MYYTWITYQVAIGELNASYDAFDTIVNLAYINPTFNKMEHGKMVVEKVGDKTIYRLAVYDSDSDKELFSELLNQLLPMIVTGPARLEHNNRNKILFHCQSGKSRSVCTALAYLCKTTCMSFDECLEMIKEKRPIAAPRPSFLDVVYKLL